MGTTIEYSNTSEGPDTTHMLVESIRCKQDRQRQRLREISPWVVNSLNQIVRPPSETQTSPNKSHRDAVMARFEFSRDSPIVTELREILAVLVNF